MNIDNDQFDPFLLQFEDLPRSKEELDIYLRFYYDVYLASKPIEDGNSSPLDFAWDIFSSMMGLKPDVKLEDYNFLGIACRSGQKSLTCATIESLALTFDRWRDYFHMASIYSQSRVTYEYCQSFLNRPYIKNTVLKSTMSETLSRFNKKLKIGTGTIRAVNSFHGSVIQDEIELTEKRVFIESKGMLSPSAGKSPLNVCISSLKHAFGNIFEMLEKKRTVKNYPLKVHKWGQLEITQYCSEERSGPLDSCLYVNSEDLVALSQDEYSKMSTDSQKDYLAYQAYHNCYDCGIFSFCLGRLKNQQRDNPFLQNIDDVRRTFLSDDVEFYKTQRLNRKPSRAGLVYPMFDPDVHLLTYDGIYRVFMREESEEELDIVKIVEVFKKHDCKFFVGLDFGFNMAAGILGVVDGQDNIYILDEIIAEFKTDAELKLMMKEKWGWINIDRVFPDIESPGAIKEFKSDFNMVDVSVEPYSKISKNVEWGLGLVRKHLRVPGKARKTKLYIYNGCEELSTEMMLYKDQINRTTGESKGKPQKVRDHACDALRYLVVGILGMYRLGYILVESTKPAVFKPDFASTNPNRPPTAMEMASYIGRGDFDDNTDEFEYKDGKYQPKTPSNGKTCKFTLA